MTETVKTSFSFTFGNETDGQASAEIDSRTAEEGGDNAARLGKTSGFLPGEAISFLVYISPNIEVDYIKSTIGTIANGKTESIKNEEELKFPNLTSTANLAKHAVSNATLNPKWIGNDLGILTLSNDQITVKLPKPSVVINSADTDDEKKRKMEQLNRPGIARVKYTTEPLLYKITVPSEASMEVYGKPPYPVEIYIYCKNKD